MISISKKKSLAWLGFCGALSSFGFICGAMIFDFIVYSSFEFAREIMRHYFMWPLTSLLLLFVFGWWRRKLYRQFSAGKPFRFRLGLLDLLSVTFFYALFTAIWMGVSARTLIETGLPVASLLSIGLVVGFMHANSQGFDGPLIKSVAAIRAVSATLARMLTGGVVISMLATIPFHERVGLHQWAITLSWLLFEDFFGEVSSNAEGRWFIALCRISLVCVPLGIACHIFATRYAPVQKQEART